MIEPTCGNCKHAIIINDHLLCDVGGLPVECCRLQGFPDDWNDNVSDTQRYKQMGNAVTVNVIEWIGKRIVNENL